MLLLLLYLDVGYSQRGIQCVLGPESDYNHITGLPTPEHMTNIAQVKEASSSQRLPLNIIIKGKN